MRSQIPFVRYDPTGEGDLAHADYTYGYADALRDGGVVRPVYFPRVDGDMEWTTATGDVVSASFQDELTRDQSSMRLRTALSLEGEWMPSVLAKAVDQLRTSIRTASHEGGQPDAGGLVIASDQEHAHGIARLLRDRFGVPADVVVSDDPGASKKIADFSTNDRPWLVAVRMVSEGVDIPRLRVGVFATTTSTELFFRQAIGRFVRWQTGRARQKAYVYIPDDPRLRAHAFSIAEARRHVLRPPDSTDDGELATPPRTRRTAGPRRSRAARAVLRILGRARTRTDISIHTVDADGGVIAGDGASGHVGSVRAHLRHGESTCVRRRTRPAGTVLRIRPRARHRAPRRADRCGHGPDRGAQHRRDEGRSADPQRPRREAARRRDRLEPLEGAGRDEPEGRGLTRRIGHQRTTRRRLRYSESWLRQLLR